MNNGAHITRYSDSSLYDEVCLLCGCTDSNASIERFRQPCQHAPMVPVLAPYLIGWAVLGPAQPWGAAMSAVMEYAAGIGLIKGESDAALTYNGKRLAEILARQATAAEVAP